MLTTAARYAYKGPPYKFNGLPNVFHFDEWPMYKDWLSLCEKAAISSMNTFHDEYLVNLNNTLLKESLECRKSFHKTDIPKMTDTSITFYDSAWNYHLTLNYDPYKSVMTRSARMIVSDGGPIETLLWFSKMPPTVVDPLQIVYGVNTLCIKRKLKEVRIVLALFPNLPFEAVAKSGIGYDIFREVLMTGDVPLIHEIWLLGALKHPDAVALADAACFEKGWVPRDAVKWYKEHRNLEPRQFITERYDYLKTNFLE